MPLDTPLLAGALALEDLRVALISESGYVIELAERRRLPIRGVSCSDGIAILLPASPLEPNTRYNLQTWSRYAGATEGESGIFFTTGTGMRDVPAPAIDVHVYAADAGAMRLLEAFVETDADEPLLVRARGQHAVSVTFFDRDAWGATPLQVPFGVVSCGELEIMDLAGNTLQQQRLCEPAKCSTTAGIGQSSCGGEVSSALSWETWQRLPNGCGTGSASDDPVSLGAAGDETLVEPPPSSLDAPESNASAGCRLSHTAPPAGARPYWLLALVGLAFQRRLTARPTPSAPTPAHRR